MSSIDNLPTISTIIKKYGLSARKNLSQNFLLDLNLTAKIARSCKKLAVSNILEVGPGPGSLTRGLLFENAKKVYAIEKDIRFLPALNELKKYYPGRLELIHGDALNHSILNNIAPPVQIFSNLPYNVGTQLLTNWLDPPEWPPKWESLTLMLQKEVADRLIASPKSKDYGRLSIISQWRSNIKIILRVPSKAFTPPPKVDSSVVQITRLRAPTHDADARVLKKIVSKAFNQRRKMLRSSLKGLTPNLIENLYAASIEPTKRAEEVSIEQYCRLANIIKL
jgi:16S rRNA (adenine1518-N6/adenine1519-N6)-dimethyltransferase